ncbi:hypothetical protein HDU78_010278 [Chytriomyces hyalinus]|nr:hypothetical protein HDU78_010278 [Chytriomyces hyalinus]
MVDTATSTSISSTDTNTEGLATLSQLQIDSLQTMTTNSSTQLSNLAGALPSMSPTESPSPSAESNPAPDGGKTAGVATATVVGGIAVVGAAAGLLFMQRRKQLGASMLNMNQSDAMLAAGAANPLYSGPGGLRENPLYKPPDQGGESIEKSAEVDNWDSMFGLKD